MRQSLLSGLAVRVAMLRLRHQPLGWWAVLFSASLMVGIFAYHAVDQSRAVAARYGSSVDVLVATRPLPAGSALKTSDVTTVPWPKGLVPSGVHPLHQVAGKTLTVALAEGEPVFDSKIGAAGLSSYASLLHDGERAVVTRGDDMPSPWKAGDTVDVIAAFNSSEVAKSGALTLVQNVRVLGVEDGAYVIAVPEKSAESVVYAVANDAVTLVLSRPIGG